MGVEHISTDTEAYKLFWSKDQRFKCFATHSSWDLQPINFPEV